MRYEVALDEGDVPCIRSHWPKDSLAGVYCVRTQPAMERTNMVRRCHAATLPRVCCIRHAARLESPTEANRGCSGSFVRSPTPRINSGEDGLIGCRGHGQPQLALAVSVGHTRCLAPFYRALTLCHSPTRPCLGASATTILHWPTISLSLRLSRPARWLLRASLSSRSIFDQSACIVRAIKKKTTSEDKLTADWEQPRRCELGSEAGDKCFHDLTPRSQDGRRRNDSDRAHASIDRSSAPI